MPQVELNVPYFKERDPKKLYTINRMKGLSMRASALEAGYSENTANQACVKLEPGHNLRMKEAIAQANVTTSRIAQVIDRGLDATKHVKDVGEVVDYKEQREFSRLALEVMGELKTGSTVAVQINLPNGFLDAWGEE